MASIFSSGLESEVDAFTTEFTGKSTSEQIRSRFLPRPAITTQALMVPGSHMTEPTKTLMPSMKRFPIRMRYTEILISS